MNRENYKIFSEAKIGSLTLKNRMVRSATCDYQATEDGRITPAELEIYRRLAEGGVGLIITGLFAVSSNAVGTKGQAFLSDDTYVSEAAKLADIVHTTDSRCRIIAQLCHPGRQLDHENTTADCVGPSDVPSPLLVKRARELSQEEIHTIVSEFADAIFRAKQAGYDGAQLHAAHGYLLSSFLSPYTNRRNDRYGGSIQKRTAILKEIITRAREKASDFPILIKMNCDDHIPEGITKDNFADLVMEVAGTGVDAIEVSGGMWDCLVRTEDELGFLPVPIPESRTHIDGPEKQSYYYNAVKDLDLPVPLILAGGHRNIEHMEALIQEGKVAFLSLSRPLICEPDLPNRFLQGIGSGHSVCVSCNACILFKDAFGCALRRHRLNRKEFETNFEKGWRAVFK